MSTLYELLGTLSHDDAEELRAAFRKAVKGAHPDLRPDDPHAALKFREIIRAREILGDPDQREVYDHLLHLAHAEQHSASSRQAIAAKIHSLTSAVIAFAATSAVIIGGYLLYAYASSSGSFASADYAEIGATGPQPAVVNLPSSFHPNEKTEVSVELTGRSLPADPIASRTIAIMQHGPHLDLSANEKVESMQASRFNRDDDFTIASIGPALQPAVIFYRQQKIAGAFAMLPVRTIQQPKICISVTKITRKSRADRAAGTPLVLSIFQTRRDIIGEKRVAQIR
jgi:curved DNA-binding protein CbpA